MAKVWENTAEVELGPANSGSFALNLERPGCGHMVTMQANMQHGKIASVEARRIRAQMESTPCEQCKKGSKA